jgi:predicted transcriptional regulator
MGYTVIAPVGDNLDALFVGMKEFAMERVYLITPRSNIKKALKLEKKLQMFSIPANILEMKEGLMESMFYQFSKIVEKHNHDDILVNVATGDRLSTCAALSAAFANGLKAFGIMEGRPMLLPIMKLSYYNELTDSKFKILSNLSKEEYSSLAELAGKLGMSVSLLSYHLNGTLKYKGLLNLRLVETKGQNKNLQVKLSSLGSLLLKGYISCG